MPTRNVVLTEHQTHFIEELVNSGRYQNASEVLREGLRLVERREQEDELRLARLREAVQLGVDDFDSGRFKTFESAEALSKHLKQLADEVLESK